MQHHHLFSAPLPTAPPIAATTFSCSQRTIVWMPFYGVGVGTGHSVVTTRFAYLNTTFWSHRRLFPHIGVCVGTQADYDFITKVRVPWYRVEIAAALRTTLPTVLLTDCFPFPILFTASPC